MIELVLNEDLWFPVAATLAIIAAVILIVKQRRHQVQRRRRIASGLNMFYGVLIGIMGFGHLIGVATKMALGILPSGTSLWFLLPCGFALAAPAWWLVFIAPRLALDNRAIRRKAIVFNVWLGAILLVPAPPLAALGVLNLVLCAAWRSD